MMRDLKTLRELSTEPFDVIIFTPQFEIIEEMLPYSRGREVKVLERGYFALLIEGSFPGR